MNSLHRSGFKVLNPLTPAPLDLKIGIFTCFINELLKSSKSSLSLALELRVKQKFQGFCGFPVHLLSPAVLLPLQGYRVVASAYAWPNPPSIVKTIGQHTSPKLFTKHGGQHG